MRSTPYALFILLFLSPAFWCCKTQHTSGGTEVLTSSSSSPMILFINMKITHDKVHDSYKVSLINTKTVAGSFKEIPSDPDTANYLNFLVCSYSTMEGNVLKTSIIEHPLYRRFESENSNGELVTRQVDLDSAEFSLRIRCQPGSNILHVSQVIRKGMQQQLGSFNIPCNENKK